MKSEGNNGYLRATVITEQNEITGGPGQETTAANTLQVRRDFKCYLNSYIFESCLEI